MDQHYLTFQLCKIRYYLSLSLCLFLSACSSTNFAPVEERWHQIIPSHGSYHVQQGDTLYAIAWRYGKDYRDIAKINAIELPYTLQKGQIIYLHAKKIKEKNIIKKTTPIEVHKVSSWAWPTKTKLVQKKFSKKNKGLDISGTPNSAVYAAADGIVAYSGNGLRNYGKLIIIKHNNDFLSAYAYNNKLLVQEGMRVKKKQKIAEMGIGVNKRFMLHFEIRRQGKPVNPLRYLPSK